MACLSLCLYVSRRAFSPREAQHLCGSSGSSLASFVASRPPEVWRPLVGPGCDRVQCPPRSRGRPNRLSGARSRRRWRSEGCVDDRPVPALMRAARGRPPSRLSGSPNLESFLLRRRNTGESRRARIHSTEPRTRSLNVGRRLIPSAGRAEAPNNELLQDGHSPARGDPAQILDGIVVEILPLPFSQDARIALPGQRPGVPPALRPHGSPLTGQPAHLPEEPPDQPGAERADVIASEPVQFLDAAK